MRLPFLEDTTPPPFYQADLTDDKRLQLDRWFIGHRSQRYYLKRFAEFDKAGRLHARWNWAAFLMTFGWLLYRKRYLDCVVYCVAGWSFIKVNIVLTLVAMEFLLMDFVPEDWRIWLRIGVAGVIWLFWAAMVARWADAYYYRMARREIADAIEQHPSDLESQKQHLQHEGGVSSVGLAVALAMFTGILLIISVQFVPIIATQQEQKIVFRVHSQANAIAKRAEILINKTGKCPVGLPVSNDEQRASFEIVDHYATEKTDCAVVATITKAYYPVRYLNGRNLVMYRSVDGQGRAIWRCQSSLNKKQTPKRCVG